MNGKASIAAAVVISLLGILGGTHAFASNAGARGTVYAATDLAGTVLPDLGGGRLFYTDYNSISDLRTIRPVWQQVQQPKAGPAGEVQTDRIQIVPASATPGTGPRKPAGATLRVELRPYLSPDGTPGDQHVSGMNNYQANRAEVYARHAVPSSTPAARWPDPVDSTRWYGISVFVPEDFKTEDGPMWFTFVQWKGLHTGSPPVALEIRRERFEISGAKRHALGRVAKGEWTNFVVGIHFSPDPQTGWLNVYRNGAEVLRQTSQATMKMKKGPDGNPVVDPSYLKQGIYRDKRWPVTHVLYFGPTIIGTSKESVAEYLK